MTIQAIPAAYNGVRFRSRIEARWAVFFDQVGVKWHYEYEGYQLPSGWYVPDFYLSDLDTWLEIKGAAPTETEEKLCAELSAHTKKRVLLAHGVFGWWTDINNYGGGDIHAWFPDGGGDITYRVCVCPVCDRVGFEYDGRGGRVCGDRCSTSDKSYTSGADRLVAAIATALAFSFWDPA